MFLSWSFQLTLLLTAIPLEPAFCRIACESECCSFLAGFQVRLKELRSSFAKIRDYYEGKDEIETALLNENVLSDFKTPYGCHAINEVLRFYLDTVLPTAKNEGADMSYTRPIESIGQVFHQLKKNLLQCRNHFACKKPFELDSMMTTYKKMQGQGLYKAMGELGLLFNYIEEYMGSFTLKH
ncbi:hypothetical protein GJAV_G00181710 [Gymnothorax javanicus]|nr:hypothetical protein GJAV_G00181710 [Gymnothorax javanicus]